MPYAVKEIYYTLQGEGAQVGRPAVFCRFAGCNLWSGHEKDRAKAICKFCDTAIVGTDGSGGGVFESASDLARTAWSHWPNAVMPGLRPFIVCTGGEPLLQLDEEAVASLHEIGFEIGVETNGTLAAPPGLDWVCVSPKANTEVLLRHGHELKLVFPQAGINPTDFEAWDFPLLYLQPMDGPHREDNTRRALAYCLQNPKWRLSLQTHKILGIL